MRDEAEKKRLVWDMSSTGSGFNDLCLELPFRYGDVARHMARCFQEGMRWAASFDERAFYHSVRVSVELARWTALKDPRSGRVWCLHRMGFGASWACFVASLIMAEMLEVLRSRGMRLPFGFLDDGMTPGRTEEEANQGLLTAVVVSASGGLQIQPTKLTFATQRLSYLGFEFRFDTEQLGLTLREQRWSRIHKMLHVVREMADRRVLVRLRIHRRAIEMLAGLLGAAAACVPGAKTRVFRVQ